MGDFTQTIKERVVDAIAVQNRLSLESGAKVLLFSEMAKSIYVFFHKKNDLKIATY